ncbi:unnamed protein product [Ectocarpus sp. CCAP 1310/34]|nr:unnamed protein product [Ectocarpus sp. CCAP 1310/34]
MDRLRSQSEGKDTTLRIARGSGIGGLFTKVSTAKKDALVAALVSRNKYVEDDLGEQPQWRTMMATTPEGARKKREREAVTTSSSAAKDATPKFMKEDQVRLAIIMMGGTMIENTLASEQSPESVADFTHQKGAGKNVYREAARAFMESSTNIELLAEISTAHGDPADLVEKWQSIDAKAPAAKYPAIWTAAAKATNERNRVEAEGGTKGKGKAKDTGGEEAAMTGSTKPGSDGRGGGSSGSDRGGASNGSKQTPKMPNWNYRAKQEEEDKTGGGGTQQDDDDNDHEYSSDDSTGGGRGDDESNSHAWTYCEGKVVNYVVHLLIESGGGFVGDMKDYFSATLDDDMCLDTLAIDVDSDLGMDSMHEAFAGGGGSAGENHAEAARKKRKSRDRRTSREEESDSTFLKGMENFLKASGPKQSLDKLGKTLASLKLMLKEVKEENVDADTIEIYEKAIKKAKKEFQEAIDA